MLNSNLMELQKKLNVLAPLKRDPYWHAYQVIRLKRFLFLNLMAFIFQYLITSHFTISYPALPFYPPIGVTFTFFYLFGFNPIVGLLVGGFFAYFLQGLHLTFTLLYLSADIIAGYLGALFCLKVFSSDTKPFTNVKEWLRFLFINAGFTAVMSALLRSLTLFLIPLIWTLSGENTGFYIPYRFIFYFISLWLADLNAILIFSAFLFSWIIVPFTREKISSKKLIYFLVGFGFFIIFSLVFIKTFELIYILILGMILSLFFAKKYGYLISMAILFIESCLYLAYFIVFKTNYITLLGEGGYLLIPTALLIYILSLFMINRS